MWLEVLALSVLSVVLLCTCFDSLNHCYLRLLEQLFEYTSQQLERARCQKLKLKSKPRQELQLQRGVKELNQPAEMLPVVGQKLRMPHKDALNARIEQCCDVLADGLRLVLEDEVTPRFAAAAPAPGEWNLLTRNLRHRKRHLNWRLYMLWLLGLILRYTLLVPLRTLGCSSCLLLVTLVTGLLGQLPEWSFKRRLVHMALRPCFRLTTWCIPVVRRIHNLQHLPRSGICVCNHTSPLDVLVLMCDCHYSLTGQRHDGILGLIQRALARASPHLWFERRALGERESLGLVLRLHATGRTRPPILLFPEGTCINNTAVMQFKKGSFAICNVVYPVAVRYDRRFGDAFWDSTRCSMMRYILMVISSWSIKCDVWYMPALRRRPNETAIDFSNRVKAAIAAQAGIEDLPWDGNLKRWNPVRDW
ncbi:glycerol-3-phosphate acyltransferase 3 [Drosophila innubila]|uniref:glycerol-3-phosphate acyltransferase 3 n=1 Tax=Drosophila innubila TaxID=198719 RepID=UPI00148C5F4A|nr:glycerol-3-phosphate acyltransferase 3 [Drosophila innubila]XP_034472260.1 glycerol-3-phosphate acyltransferase 3 [Drosophila innubila]